MFPWLLSFSPYGGSFWNAAAPGPVLLLGVTNFGSL